MWWWQFPSPSKTIPKNPSLKGIIFQSYICGAFSTVFLHTSGLRYTKNKPKIPAASRGSTFLFYWRRWDDINCCSSSSKPHIFWRKKWRNCTGELKIQEGTFHSISPGRWQTCRNLHLQRQNCEDLRGISWPKTTQKTRLRSIWKGGSS